MSRPTILASVAGALLVLILGAGFLALDKTVLHWYDADPEEVQAPTNENTLSAAEAEAMAADYLTDVAHADPDSGEAAWIDQGWRPFCDAVERAGTSSGWVVHCGMHEVRGDGEVRQLVTYIVSDSGRIRSVQSSESLPERRPPAESIPTSAPEPTAVLMSSAEAIGLAREWLNTGGSDPAFPDFVYSTCTAERPILTPAETEQGDNLAWSVNCLGRSDDPDCIFCEMTEIVCVYDESRIVVPVLICF